MQRALVGIAQSSLAGTTLSGSDAISSRRLIVRLPKLCCATRPALNNSDSPEPPVPSRSGGRQLGRSEGAATNERDKDDPTSAR